MSTRKKLTRIQVKVAESLRYARPGVIPGTNVIPDTEARERWYEAVTHCMDVNKVPPDLVSAFCDIAGVPS